MSVRGRATRDGSLARRRTLPPASKSGFDVGSNKEGENVRSRQYVICSECYSLGAVGKRLRTSPAACRAATQSVSLRCRLPDPPESRDSVRPPSSAASPDRTMKRDIWTFGQVEIGTGKPRSGLWPPRAGINSRKTPVDSELGWIQIPRCLSPPACDLWVPPCSNEVVGHFPLVPGSCFVTSFTIPCTTLGTATLQHQKLRSAACQAHSTSESC